MAYEPTTWKSGDVVTSAKLNKMEQGIAGAGPLVIGYSSYEAISGTETIDHTWQEIHDAMASGRLVILSRESAEDGGVFHEIIMGCSSAPEDNEYEVVTTTDKDFVASSPDGYPHNGSGIPTPDDPVG